MWYNKVMTKGESMAKKKMTIKEKVFLVCCAIIGLLVGLWLATGFKPSWQKREDAQISSQRNAGKLDEYVLTRFVLSIRPDGKTQVEDSTGEKYSYLEQYNYVANTLGYECRQLQEYDDDLPYEKIAECHKK